MKKEIVVLLEELKWCKANAKPDADNRVAESGFVAGLVQAVLLVDAVQNQATKVHDWSTCECEVCAALRAV